MTNSKIWMIASLLLAGFAGLPAAQAQTDDDLGCSNRSIRGTYGFSVEGTLGNNPSNAPSAAAIFRAVALTTFDGKGGLTQVDHYVVNGVPQTPPNTDWPASSGTYTVNANCTGKLTLNVPGLPPFVSFFIVTRSGKEIRTVLNSNVVSSVGEKLD